jgi:vacuolar-type H+-ATPase subunit H
MNPKGSTAAPASSDLTLLLATEQDIETALAAARADARAVVEAAEADSRRSLQELELELQEAGARFTAEVDGERARRGERLLMDARRRVAEYEAVSEDRIEALADRALHRLLSGIGQ